MHICIAAFLYLLPAALKPFKKFTSLFHNNLFLS
jgi:hypothetical protein